MAVRDPHRAAAHGAHPRPRRARAQRRRRPARRRARARAEGRQPGHRHRRRARPDHRQHRADHRCWRSTTTTSGTATWSSARPSAWPGRWPPTCPGCSSSRSTGSPTTCSRGRCATATHRCCRAGCARARTRLARWETDWSSQTGACQAGLLHGDNDDMPAFRWWEKEHGKAIVTNHPRDAEELERRHSNGRGLLFSNGASRANILSGDAPAQPADDEHGAAARPPRPPGPGLLRLLRQPLQRAAHRRARRRARWSASAGPRSSRSAAASSRASTAARVRAHARVGDGHPTRPAGGGRDRATCTPACRSRTRPSSPTTRSPTTRASSGPTRCRRCGRVDRQIGRIAAARRRRAAALPARRALRPRPVPGRDVPGPLRDHARGARARAPRPRRWRPPPTTTRRSGYLGASLTEASGGDVAGGPGGPSHRRAAARSTARCSSRGATPRRTAAGTSRPRSW